MELGLLKDEGRLSCRERRKMEAGLLGERR